MRLLIVVSLPTAGSGGGSVGRRNDCQIWRDEEREGSH